MNRYKVLFQSIFILVFAIGFSLGVVTKAVLASKPSCALYFESYANDLDSERIGSCFDLQTSTTNEDIAYMNRNGGGHALMGW